MNLLNEEKLILLKAARDSIRSQFEKFEIENPDYNKFPLLKSQSGAFVTITIFNNLRGCIGYILSDIPLFQTVCDAAIQASQNDPRFPPLRVEEIPQISLEISVLSKPFPMNSYDDIEIGKHGLILEEGGRRGLLLPQVPVEHNMNREQYLSALCRKTGFDEDYWKKKVLTIEMFTADVFSEKDLGVKNENG
jgi:AmmeMemoRadiSam system protein A